MDLEIFPHEHFMQKAFQQAQAAREIDEVPVGAIIARGGKIIGAAHGRGILGRDSVPSTGVRCVVESVSSAIQQKW